MKDKNKLFVSLGAIVVLSISLFLVKFIPEIHRASGNYSINKEALLVVVCLIALSVLFLVYFFSKVFPKLGWLLSLLISGGLFLSVYIPTLLPSDNPEQVGMGFDFSLLAIIPFAIVSFLIAVISGFVNRKRNFPSAQM